MGGGSGLVWLGSGAVWVWGGMTVGRGCGYRPRTSKATDEEGEVGGAGGGAQGLMHHTHHHLSGRESRWWRW